MAPAKKKDEGAVDVHDYEAFVDGLERLVKETREALADRHEALAEADSQHARWSGLQGHAALTPEARAKFADPHVAHWEAERTRLRAESAAAEKELRGLEALVSSGAAAKK